MLKLLITNYLSLLKANSNSKQYSTPSIGAEKTHNKAKLISKMFIKNSYQNKYKLHRYNAQSIHRLNYQSINLQKKIIVLYSRLNSTVLR